MAFHDDPVMQYMLRSPARRPRQLRTFFTVEMARALRKGAVITSDGTPGGAVWMGPDNWRLGGIELISMWRVALAFGAALPRALGVLNRVEKLHPREPHWYLAVLGTEPASQGKGFGSAFLRPVLERCDEEGLPAYLESSKESNIAFYARHHFEVTGEVAVPGGPTIWPMWRAPQAANS